MCKILIVEDDPANMFLYRKTLENSGHDIIMATNGDEACEIARKYNPDMILLDIYLPGKNGFEVFDELKSSGGRCATIPVIFASASFDIGFIVQKTGVPREYIMRKPINFVELNGLVKKIQDSSTNCKDLSYA
ncbi:MAG: response regulator [Paludibacter sp.]|nr:response regulator [Paludibacter sp.]